MAEKDAKKSMTHLDENKNPHMVDIGQKQVSIRVAKASGIILLEKSTIEAIQKDQIEKGSVLATATVAGINAAKNTSNAIPLCHNIALHNVKIEFEYIKNGILVRSTIKTEGKTGAEMEALHSVSVTCLTIYDMVKSIDKTATITDIKLEYKSGGKSGEFVAKLWIEKFSWIKK